MQPLLTRLMLATLTLILLFGFDSVFGPTIQSRLTETLGLTAQKSRLLFLTWLVVVGALANLTIRIVFRGQAVL